MKKIKLFFVLAIVITQQLNITRLSGTNLESKSVSAKVNSIINPGFEGNLTDSWEVTGILGAKGKWEVVSDVKRSGEHSLKLSKTNSFGYFQLSSKKPVHVEADSTYTLRFWFNSSNAQVTSFMIPRLVNDINSTAVVSPYSALWNNYDYDSQSLMRNSPSTNPENWVKRIVFYENRTGKPQDIYIQVMLYGNPFDGYVDDFEFESGQQKGKNTPVNPEFKYTVEQVNDIISKRPEVTAYFSGKDGVSHFFVNGKEEWPIFYRGRSRRDASGNTSSDPGGFSAAGVDIESVFIRMSGYGTGSGTSDWDRTKSEIINNLRKNPNARLLIDIGMGADLQWLEKYPDENWETKEGKKMNNPSYSSKQWRIDGAESIRHFIRDMKEHGYWKLVAGVNMMGGHDGQFWTKAIGEYAVDYAPGNKKAWHEWLKEQYSDIKLLNSIWKTNYTDFNQIPIPDSSPEQESYPAIMPKGPVPDYRQFCESASFDLRECFAKAVREESGKEIFVSAYGVPMENQHGRFLQMAGKTGKANNVIAAMSFYSYRQPGFASGFHPEQSFGFHNTQFMQELDLRYFTSDMGWFNELILMWVGSQPNITDWRNMHRKLVGISLAQNQGYWYYDMEKQYINDDELKEIGAVKKIADNLVTRKGVPFKPDVCLIRFGAESRYYGTSVDNSVGATDQWQYMLLETSGVPYDIHYLSDVMAEPTLQKYKIYIFHNNTILTAKEREWINSNLKNNKRTIIWLYDSGYGNEEGLSTNAISEVTGMKINTSGGYTRSIASINGVDKLAGGMVGYLKVPEFQGMTEALCSIFTTSGPAWLIKPSFSKSFGYTVAPGVSRYQKFWIDSGYDNVLGKYIDDGKAAMAVKRFPDWTSIYIGAPNALAGEMMNNIAKETGAYRSGTAAMGELRMSGRFVSYHALRSGKYDFQLPKGASKVIDAETGKVLAEKASSFTIDGKAQTTYWYFIE